MESVWITDCVDSWLRAKRTDLFTWISKMERIVSFWDADTVPWETMWGKYSSHIVSGRVEVRNMQKICSRMLDEVNISSSSRWNDSICLTHVVLFLRPQRCSDVKECLNLPHRNDPLVYSHHHINSSNVLMLPSHAIRNITITSFLFRNS